MKRTFSLLCSILLIFGSFGVATATIHEYGNNGEMFYDDGPYMHGITGLYWYDPIEFAGWTRAEVDAFIAENPEWNYATHDQLFVLHGSLGFLTDLTGPKLLGDPTYTKTRTFGSYPEFPFRWEYFEGWNEAVTQGDETWDKEFFVVEIFYEANGYYVYDIGFGDRTYHLGGWKGGDESPGGAWLVTQNPLPVPDASIMLLLGPSLIGPLQCSGESSRSKRLSSIRG